MCMYVHVHFVIGFFSFFVRLGPLGLVILKLWQCRIAVVW